MLGPGIAYGTARVQGESTIRYAGDSGGVPFAYGKARVPLICIREVSTGYRIAPYASSVPDVTAAYAMPVLDLAYCATLAGMTVPDSA
eukprot:74791-Rhodomonas_salina.3